MDVFQEHPVLENPKWGLGHAAVRGNTWGAREQPVRRPSGGVYLGCLGTQQGGPCGWRGESRVRGVGNEIKEQRGVGTACRAW